MMRLAEAKRVIFEGVRPSGYRVHFERIAGKFLAGDYFPERDEPLIASEVEAWELAEKFAAATKGLNVNVFVVDDRWCPVAGYEARKIVNR